MKIYALTLILFLTAFSNVYTQDFWEKTSAPDDVTTYSLAVHSNGNIFAGAYTDGVSVGINDGVYRSTNNGNNWSKLGLSSNYEAHSIIISPNGDVLVGTWQQPAGPHKLFRSADNGVTWDTLGINRMFTSIAFNSIGHIFVGTQSEGIFRSVDNGLNWVQINQGLSVTHVTSLLINSGDSIFVGTIYGGVYRSTDNGENWVSTSQGLTTNYILSLAINSSGDIFAGTSSGGVFRSTDNGGNWLQINQNLTGEGLYVRSLAINSAGYIYAGTAAGIYRTSDNGNNWVQINQGLTSNDVQSLAINSGGNIFAGTAGGIFRSFLSANIRVFLEGPYNGAGGMTTTLNTNNLIPLNSNTAYSTVTYSYTASTVGSIPYPDIVDWVLVELRTGTASGTKVATRAAFLKNDGTIVDIDGTSPVHFPSLFDGNYYIVIRHRNHLAIMSASAVPLGGSSVLYDFTATQTQAYGTNPMVAISGGVFGMIAADGSRDGSINATDLNTYWIPQNGTPYDYQTKTADFNLDATINATDLNVFWIPGNGKATQVP